MRAYVWLRAARRITRALVGPAIPAGVREKARRPKLALNVLRGQPTVYRVRIVGAGLRVDSRYPHAMIDQVHIEGVPYRCAVCSTVNSNVGAAIRIEGLPGMEALR